MLLLALFAVFNLIIDYWVGTNLLDHAVITGVGGKQNRVMYMRV